jgi:hypothetical protein
LQYVPQEGESMNQLEMIAWMLNVLDANRNDKNGDRHLRDADRFVEACDTVVNWNQPEAIRRLIREGWLPGHVLSIPQGDPS